MLSYYKYKYICFLNKHYLWNAIDAFIHYFSLKKNDFSLKKNDVSLKKNDFSLKKDDFF